MTTDLDVLDNADIPSASDDHYVPVGVDGVLAATQKALAINRGLAEQDHRDGIQFKRIMNTPDLLSERVRLDATGSLRKTLGYAARHRSLKGFMPGALSDLVTKHITASQLASPLEEINPLDVANQARRVTLLGPGGVSSADMITDSMQAIHPSIFGFLSPIEGPESGSAGVDTRLANGVKIGSNGRLYQKFRNPRTGDIHWLSPEDLRGKVIGLPR
jgi:DNA-directed RNA polymerase beta subunit